MHSTGGHTGPCAGHTVVVPRRCGGTKTQRTLRWGSLLFEYRHERARARNIKLPQRRSGKQKETATGCVKSVMDMVLKHMDSLEAVVEAVVKREDFLEAVVEAVVKPGKFLEAVCQY